MKNQLIKLTFALLTFSMGIAAQAAITCTTPRESKVVIINNDSISLSSPQLFKASRDVASVSNVRTKIKGSGFTKIMYMKGQKHTIHIENKDSFTDVNDYMMIRSKEGHQMIYPLSCQS